MTDPSATPPEVVWPASPPPSPSPWGQSSPPPVMPTTAPWPGVAATPPPPPPPPPPRPPSKGHTGLAIGIVAGGLVLLMLCVGALVLGRRLADALPTQTAMPSPTPSPSVSLYTGHLEDLLAPPPADALPWSGVDVSGDMTIDELAEAFYFSPEEVAAGLRDSGVEAVAASAWFNDDIDVLVELYQFGRAAEAKLYLRSTRVSGLTGMTYEGEAQMDPAAIWFSSESDELEQAIYMVARGDIVCTVTVWDYAFTGHANAYDVAEEQFDLLPAA